MFIKIDKGVVCDSGKDLLYAINLWIFRALFVLQLRSYQTDKIRIRFYRMNFNR